MASPLRYFLSDYPSPSTDTEETSRLRLRMGAANADTRSQRILKALSCLLAACLLGAPWYAHAACDKRQPGWMWNYDGQIADKHRIRMTLVFGEEEITGMYFYASRLVDIQLRGRRMGATHAVLEELDATGSVGGHFEVEFPEKAPESKFGDSPLQCEVMRGTWSRTGATGRLPFQLSLESGTAGSPAMRYAALGVRDPESLHRNSQAFWLAVRRDDRKVAATLVRYPIRVDTAVGRKRYAGPRALLEDYELIFTPRFREQIAMGMPRNMFVRSEGAMLGSGQIWFGADGRVTAINNY